MFYMSSVGDAEALRNELQAVFQQVFEDEDLVLGDSMTADDVAGWDSLAHINLIIAVEKHFEIRFATAEISGLKMEGQNVGTFLRLVQKKLGAKA
jgi:acyl carrier protein